MGINICWLGRVVAGGVIATAVVVGPTLVMLDVPNTALSNTAPTHAVPSQTVTLTASDQCLAWYGSRDSGQCLGYSNGTPTYIGTPQFGLFGPDTGGPGFGISTGPLLPGQTITIPMG